jgi:peptidoglycan biosynthesis protein MviN/MurJ (putative lipid II flippase)
VLLWSGIAVVVGAPVVVTATGYLLAAGEPGAVVSAAAGSTVVWLVVATPLVGVFGAPAVGMGWVAAAAVSATFLWHRVSRRLEPEGVALSALAIALPLGAVAAAWLVAHQVDDRVLGGAVGLAVGESIEVLGLVVLQRSALRQLRDLGRQALRSFGALRG